MPTLPKGICLVIVLFCFVSCTHSTKKSTFKRAIDEIIVHELTEPVTLNPITAADAPSLYVLENIYLNLISLDPFSLQLVPVLAKSLPTHAENEKGEQFYTYEIRQEAVWDNGKPITAKDVEFTLKATKNPKVDDAHNRVYYDLIQDIILYEDNPRKFTIVLKEKYLKAILISGDITVLPSEICDPKGLMNNFSVKQLAIESKKLADDPNIIEFANWFNSEKFQREKDYVISCGPYELEEWITGQKVVLKRKDHWWGDALKGANSFFNAEPNRLIFQTINDYASAVTALKGENIDVMRSIPVKMFMELKSSEKTKANYNFYTPDQLAYYNFGINSKLPKFSDKTTRQALAHLVDVNKIIEVAAYGMGMPTIGPIYPEYKKFYNSDIKPYAYDLEKAKQMLAEAGWVDSDGNGMVDKELNGKREDFIIKLAYNNGNEARKIIASMFQEEARKVGISVEVIGQDMSIFVETKKKHDFEMYVGGFQSSPVPDDPKQVFHSTSANDGGSNYVSFGNPESDELIEKIRVELDEEKRAVMFKRLQEIIHEEACHLFLYFPTERICIHKRIENAKTTIRRPGYWAAGMKTLDAE